MPSNLTTKNGYIKEYIRSDGKYQQEKPTSYETKAPMCWTNFLLAPLTIVVLLQLLRITN